MTTAKAIETSYAGHRFRSRLEARWAVFFDHLRMEWLYEPEGFEIGPAEGRRRYLPDFYLPGRAAWVEVKGNPETLDLDLLADAAHPAHGLPLTLGRSDLGWPLVKTRILVLGSVPERPLIHQSIAVINGEVVAAQPVLPICDHGDEGHRHHFVSLGHAIPLDEMRDANLLSTWGYGFVCPDIIDAYAAARSARFEHGESGVPSQRRRTPTAVGPPTAAEVKEIARKAPSAAARMMWPAIVAAVKGYNNRQGTALESATLTSAARRTFALTFPTAELASIAERGDTPPGIPAYNLLGDVASEKLGGRWRATYSVAKESA